MTDSLKCPGCGAVLPAGVETDGFQKTLRARCQRCGRDLEATVSAQALGALDGAGLAISGVSLLALLSLVMWLSSVQQMLPDLGGTVPALTNFVLRTELPVPLLVVCALLSAGGAALKARGRRVGRALIWAGALLGLAGAAVCVVGAYLPLIEMMNAVQPD